MLSIRLLRVGDPSEATIEERVFEGGRLTIGRGADCDWRLEDKATTLSRLHCELYNRGEQVFVTDHSANGAFLNGAHDRLDQGASVAVGDGDRLQIGGYLLIFRSPPARGAGGGGSIGADFDVDFLDGGEQGDMVGSLTSRGAPKRTDSLIDEVGALSRPQADDAGVGPPTRGRGDLDVAVEPLLGRAERSAAEAQIPADWDLLSTEESDPDADRPGGAPEQGAVVPPADFAAADTGAKENPAPSVGPALRRERTGLGGAEEDLLAAFLEGAGLDPASFRDDDPVELMRRAGAAYRQSVLNFCDILRDRSFLKNEFRIERTLIGVEANNPLKFSDPREAAAKLLKAPERGFLDGQSALREAGEDIKKHQIAVLAGVRFALETLLDRFRPSSILKRAAKEQGERRRLMGSGDPVKQAWSKFETLHEVCAEEASTSSDGFVNRAFRAGYESQMDKLEKSGR